MGEIWSAEVGQSLSCPRTSCFSPPPTHINVYVFLPECTGRIEVAFSATHFKKPGSYPLNPCSFTIEQAVTLKVKACTQISKHVDAPMDTNRFPLPLPLAPVYAIRGIAGPLQPQQLYILRFYDLDLICKCHRVALKGSA